VADRRTLGLPLDDEGHVVGYMVGRSAALADWQHKQAKAEFARFCHRLVAANYARRLRETDPMIAREAQRRWRAAHREEINRQNRERLRTRARRLAHVCTCEVCGEQWLCCGGRRRGRFCSQTCRQRWWDQHRKPRVTRGNA
jgi:hypothetical protein